MLDKIIEAKFYRSPSGNEPVRVWLNERTPEDRKSIGEDIKAVEFLWPIGYPQVVKLDKDLWEVRTNIKDGICRVFFTVWEGYMVLLHSIVKKTQKTPEQDLKTAKKRRNVVFARGLKNE